MINEDNIAGYGTGHDDGYCRNPPKFHPVDKSSSFVASYILGYVDGGEFRDIIESQLKKQYKNDDFELMTSR
jgi:hypothetical protein